MRKYILQSDASVVKGCMRWCTTGYGDDIVTMWWGVPCGDGGGGVVVVRCRGADGVSVCPS